MVWMVMSTDRREGRGRGRCGQDDSQPEAMPCGRLLLVDRWRGGCDSIAQKRTRWPRVLSVMVRRGECERLAMVWMVKTSDGAEGEAMNWR